MSARFHRVGIVLAAGAGRRAGGPKALRTDPDGTSWLVRAVGVLRSGGCASVVVVLGAAADEAQRRLVEPAGTADRTGVRVVIAPDWARGMGHSLRTGLAAAAEQDPDAVLVHLVDLPDVTADVVERLVAVGGGRDVLARATYAGRPGHPVLIGAHHLAGVVAGLSGDSGAQEYLGRSGVRQVECGDLATGLDCDT